MTDIVTIEHAGHVATIRFNRPDKHNALNVEMFDAIISAGESVARDPSVRAVVLCGAGPSFCAGLDFAEMQSLSSGPDKDSAAVSHLFQRDSGPDNRAQRTSYIWKTIDVPVIAALHGAVYGGGFQIGLGADIRIADPASKFSIMEIRYGLVPDMAITQTLPDVLRYDQALELTLSGRVFGAEEALSLGLVTAVDGEALARATALAGDIAGKSPTAVRAVKQLYRESWRADPHTGLRREEALQRELIGSNNQIEAVMASLEKRPANFD